MSAPAEGLPWWLTTACLSALTLTLLRVAVNLIQTASSSPASSTSISSSTSSAKTPTSGDSSSEQQQQPPKETDSLLAATRTSRNNNDHPKQQQVFMVLFAAVVIVMLLSLIRLLTANQHRHRTSFLMIGCTGVALAAFELLLYWRRFSFNNTSRPRVLQVASQALYLLVVLASCSGHFWTMMFPAISLVGVTIGEWWWCQSKQKKDRLSESDTDAESDDQVRPQLSRKALWIMLKPYFWPALLDDEEDGDRSAGSPESTPQLVFLFISLQTRLQRYSNRIRVFSTWACVVCAKACGLVSPMCLGWASTSLAHQDYADAVRYSIAYSVLSLLQNICKEGQSLLYLKVAQAAFGQLSGTAFGHLHSLSLDWHLRKKMGETLRSMDRGISACDTLMKYLFLWLVPAGVECLVVCMIFATYFQYLPLAISVFYFVFLYIVWTILVTLWRKKFRKALVKSDNNYHDRFTDSLLNFETVKYFTAESYETKMFRQAVDEYQKGSVNVQSSLSFLNISQQLLLKTCLATALSLTVFGIKRRMDCCVSLEEPHGCDSGLSDCCRAVSHTECPGMQVGDFVAVLTYTLNLFSPLNFLGSVYNAIVMAVVDLTNLSELLAENPDVQDAADSLELPHTAATTEGGDVAVEFDNVVFHYPSQNSTQGLRGLSFQMKRGTTTAIVGPTGAGKTTVGRLLFRFYDVLGGSVKVNGVDVRAVTQQSLRGAIGVVPQAASMFNDTLKSNLLYGKRGASMAELEQAAKDAQLMGFIDQLDDGWEAMVGDRGLKLSGGEKQRAAIARCLLKNPPIVLLDEATSALDTLTENSVQESLDRLGADRTVLVIAHRLGTIRNADNIVVLKDGKVAEQGTHESLLNIKNGVYADMWNMQLHSTSANTSQLGLSDLK